MKSLYIASILLIACVSEGLSKKLRRNSELDGSFK